jgi:UDP-glucuronate decarboxylase
MGEWKSTLEGVVVLPSNDMSKYRNILNEDLDYICRNASDQFAKLSGANVLITGGAGFLGYYLVQCLLHWNKRQTPTDKVIVTVYDKFIYQVPSWLQNLQGSKDLKVISHDISQGLPENTANFQFIIHAASIASPSYYRKFPIETMDANVYGLRALLEYCRSQQDSKEKVEGLLFLSSSEIYGDPSSENIPTPEGYRGNVSCTGPRACYDESKRFGETLCVNFAAQYGLPIKIVRPFNNYGPGLGIHDRRVIADFARCILENRDIVMLSDGSPTRTFCYVGDAINGYYRALVVGRTGEAYNIGTEAPEVSMMSLAESVATTGRELFGYTGRVVRQVSSDRQYLVDSPIRRCPSIAKARAELGYSPSISLDEGLRRSLIWYRGYYGTEL